jgi:hypothetical protein
MSKTRSKRASPKMRSHKSEAGFLPQSNFFFVTKTNFSDNEEVKLIANNLTTLGNLSTTTSDTNLSQLIAGGTDLTQRLGRQIRIKEFQLSGVLRGGQTNSIADDAFNTVRMVLYVAEQGTAITGLQVSSLLDLRIYPGVNKVLFDRTYTLVVNSKDSTGYIPVLKELKIHQLMSHLQNYTGSAANTASGPQLHMAIVTDSSVPAYPVFTSGGYAIVFEDY